MNRIKLFITLNTTSGNKSLNGYNFDCLIEHINSTGQRKNKGRMTNPDGTTIDWEREIGEKMTKQEIEEYEDTYYLEHAGFSEDPVVKYLAKRLKEIQKGNT